MGFAWKSSLGLAPKGGDDNVGVLAAPDTEFGPELEAGDTPPANPPAPYDAPIMIVNFGTSAVATA